MLVYTCFHLVFFQKKKENNVQLVRCTCSSARQHYTQGCFLQTYLQLYFSNFQADMTSCEFVVMWSANNIFKVFNSWKNSEKKNIYYLSDPCNRGWASTVLGSVSGYSDCQVHLQHMCATSAWRLQSWKHCLSRPKTNLNDKYNL